MLFACDPGLTIFYQVKNDTKSQIKINYRCSEYDWDSMYTNIIIPEGKCRLIFTDHRLGIAEMVKDIDFIPIDYLEITSNKDTAKAKIDFTNPKNWIFSSKKKDEAWFTLTVN